MIDKCREEFEKWFRKNYNHPPAGTGDAYISSIASNHWVAWSAAWETAKSQSPAPRDGWLTAEEIDSIAQHPDQTWATELTVLCDMARAAISLHAELAALFSKLRAAIDTIERGDV